MVIPASGPIHALGSAPAKIILFGEHAVVYGEPALGFALSRGVKIQVKRGSGQVQTRFAADVHAAIEGQYSSPVPMIRKALGNDFDDLDVDVTFEVPLSAGLGSSAALSVALLRARCALLQTQMEHSDLLAEAIEIENVAHGRSSGLDPAICLEGGLIGYRKTIDEYRVEHIKLSQSFHVVIGVYGDHGGTNKRVQAIADLRTMAPNAIDTAIRALGEAATWGMDSLKTGQWDQAGIAMDLAHGVLSGLGLVGDIVESMVRAARHEGAYGAKMSGSGGDGGAFFALVPDIQTGNAIEVKWQEAGAETWIETAS